MSSYNPNFIAKNMPESKEDTRPKNKISCGFTGRWWKSQALAHDPYLMQIFLSNTDLDIRHCNKHMFDFLHRTKDVFTYLYLSIFE